MHGHSAGGTNPSLVEAMYLGLPVVAYSVQYNKETTEDKALYFDSKDTLVRLLESIDVERLEKTAKDMHQIALEKYTWEKISNLYSGLFL